MFTNFSKMLNWTLYLKKLEKQGIFSLKSTSAFKYYCWNIGWYPEILFLTVVFPNSTDLALLGNTSSGFHPIAWSVHVLACIFTLPLEHQYINGLLENWNWYIKFLMISSSLYCLSLGIVFCYSVCNAVFKPLDIAVGQLNCRTKEDEKQNSKNKTSRNWATKMSK